MQSWKAKGSGYKVDYSYDGLGRATSQFISTDVTGTTSSVLTRSYSYLAGANGNTTTLVSGLTYSGRSTSAYVYEYDARDNITAVYKNGTRQASYVYDDLNQLVRENNVTANKTWVYTYDERGNILSRKTYAYTTGTLGTVQDTDTYEYYDQSSSTMWGDALLRYDGTNFISYDAIGNPLYYVNGPDQGYAYVFSWQNGRQLASGTKGTTEFAYTYNADGLRTKKVVNGVTTEYYWAGSQLAMMIVNPDLSTKKVLKFYYDAEGRPLCLDFNGTVYYYITNLQGDVVALADQYGEVIRYEYDAWGKPISTYYVASPYYDAMQYNPLRYRGYIYDNETGFYYLQSRYYDPAVGRFINSDAYASTGQGVLGHNMFAYCGNNPVNRSDTMGQSWAIVGIVIVLAVVLMIPGSSVSTTDSDVLVMSNSESGWMESSKAMGQSMKHAAKASSSHVEATTTANFSQIWNNTTSDYVVIHTHGSPDGLFGKNLSFTTNDVSTLNRNTNIQCLVITSCEVGGSNGSKDNVGQMLSQKISPSGIVICSTTIVSGNDKRFKSTGGGEWVVYQNGIQIAAVFPTTITMSTVADYWNDFSN